ncbi:hypothetical protein [Actinomadura sediminis]|uniref:Uncharacterized protein n=1 Tax=Actinomadura sediminis TaxID=1038904 RepID=A0ABW3EKD1_9ACTN
MSKIANGLKNPSAELAERLDDVLEAHGELAACRSSIPFRWSPAPEEEERLTLISQRPARLDTGALDALAALLAAQRRAEDAIGPTALLGPVASQLAAVMGILRDATGPLRDPLGRIAAEWTVFAGWLHAAVRQDAHALRLFGRGEELADDYDDGTIGTAATSFRGYVARRQGRPRAVVRAAMAAMATPGGRPPIGAEE